MEMLVQPVLGYGRGVRGAGCECLTYVELSAESHWLVHLASLYHCCEFGRGSAGVLLAASPDTELMGFKLPSSMEDMVQKQHNWYQSIACSTMSVMVVKCTLNSFAEQRTS